MEQAIICDIQHFSVSDGPGIRTTVFFKGCNLRCAWCHNVECISFKPEVMNIKQNQKNISKICGRYVTIYEVLKEIFEDEKFYLKSGGGVTFSGGEPLLQADFLKECLKLIKEKGIHTIVDTAGDVSFDRFEKIIPYTNTFFFDVKANNEKDYLKLVGGNFNNIMSNLERLIKFRCDVVVRIPIIPDHNFSEEYMEKTCEMLKKIGVKKLQIIPFHRLGVTKYESLNKEYKYKNVESLNKKSLTNLLKICEKYFESKIDC